MLRSLNGLERYKVTATDGDVGTVSDFLLDDHANAPDAPAKRAYTWAVRYLIVQTGGFFHRRRVLVSPISIRGVDAAERRFHLALTVEKIRSSPSFDAEKPVSRAHEREHLQYYHYPYYWDSSGLWGMGSVPGGLATASDGADPLDDDRPTEPGADARFETAETHLRSAREVLGYHVQTEEGVAGHVEDFLVDDETYEVRSLVVNTSRAGVGQKVLLAPSAVTRVSWEERNLYVSASQEAVIGGAPYERSEENPTTDGDRADAAENLIDSDTTAAHEAVGAAGGAIAGGILGAVAGPPGVAAGAVLGGIAGAVTEAALERGAQDDAAHTREVDAELGVSGGDLGAKNLRHPPAKRGTYTGASVGVGDASGEVPAEGPIPPSR